MNRQQIENGRNEIAELKLNLSEYRGKWKSANGLTKVCSWADEIIPNTPANFCLFNDAGEWIVSPKYRKNGWENLYNAYHNETLATDEIQKLSLIHIYMKRTKYLSNICAIMMLTDNRHRFS